MRPVPELPSADAEARAFGQMRMCRVRAVLTRTMRQDRLRLATVAVLSAILWGALFWLFGQGFAFIASMLPDDLYDQTVQVVFGMFFMTL